MLSQVTVNLVNYLMVPCLFDWLRSKWVSGKKTGKKSFVYSVWIACNWELTWKLNAVLLAWYWLAPFANTGTESLQELIELWGFGSRVAAFRPEFCKEAYFLLQREIRSSKNPVFSCCPEGLQAASQRPSHFYRRTVTPLMGAIKFNGWREVTLLF